MSSCVKPCMAISSSQVWHPSHSMKRSKASRLSNFIQKGGVCIYGTCPHILHMPQQVVYTKSGSNWKVHREGDDHLIPPISSSVKFGQGLHRSFPWGIQLEDKECFGFRPLPRWPRLTCDHAKLDPKVLKHTENPPEVWSFSKKSSNISIHVPVSDVFLSGGNLAPKRRAKGAFPRAVSLRGAPGWCDAHRALVAAALGCYEPHSMCY